MNGEIFKNSVRSVVRFFREFVLAYLIIYIQTGGVIDKVMLAKLVLTLKLNIFALPLSNMLEFPPWIWYVVSILWVNQIRHWLNGHGRETLEQVGEELEKHYDIKYYLIVLLVSLGVTIHILRPF